MVVSIAAGAGAGAIVAVVSTAGAGSAFLPQAASASSATRANVFFMVLPQREMFVMPDTLWALAAALKIRGQDKNEQRLSSSRRAGRGWPVTACEDGCGAPGNGGIAAIR